MQLTTHWLAPCTIAQPKYRVVFNLEVDRNILLSFFGTNTSSLQKHSFLKLIFFTKYFFTTFNSYLPLLKQITGTGLIHYCHCCFISPERIWKSERYKCRFETPPTIASSFSVQTLANLLIKSCGFLLAKYTSFLLNISWIAAILAYPLINRSDCLWGVC